MYFVLSGHGMVWAWQEESNDILGVWFHKEDERDRMIDVLNRYNTSYLHIFISIECACVYGSFSMIYSR